MIRLFISGELGSGVEIALEREASHYIANVMRQIAGAHVALFNGRDGEWKAQIVEVGKRTVRLVVGDRMRPQKASPDLELIVAVVKRPRLETIIEKATELGARRVSLVLTSRTNAERVRTERLTAIATEAAEQTGRLDVPQIEDAVKLVRLLEHWDQSRRILFCDEGGEAKPVLEALKGAAPGPWAILIGPEGGFAPDERNRLRTSSFVTPATLGPRILRADTAAISAMTLWQAGVGDWRA